MHVISARNVNDAYAKGMTLFADKDPETFINLESRAGAVKKFRMPVTIHYKNPRERVLFDPERDANPYFHVMESVWMLLGRNDVASITRWIKKFTEFSDDGAHLHGAYGYRWRRHFIDGSTDYIDQIEAVIERLKKTPSCRRAFIGMYDPCTDAYYSGKDMPCNLGIKVWIEEGALNIHVFNRSNDFIWGATGANVVHMSFLQEYLAGKLGVRVGQYWQTASDMHVYTPVFDKHRKPSYEHTSFYDFKEGLKTLDMGSGVEGFDEDLLEFWNDTGKPIQNPWVLGVLGAMRDSWDLLKEKRYDDAYEAASYIAAPDWSAACKAYIIRRMK
jgi:hypothetical protein